MTQASEHMADQTPVEQARAAAEREHPAGQGGEAAVTAAVASGSSAVEIAEAWLSELSDRMSVPASDVQDHLLDLWGLLEEGPARAEVERWLTETLRRNLYSVTDINERLETLLPSSN